jgi:apolipoprotein N-acyltransferase
MTLLGAVCGGMLSGALHALALQPPLGWVLAWMALVPLLVVATRAAPRRVAVAAMAYVFTLLFIDVPPWLTPAVGRYFHFAPPRDTLAVALATGLVALVSGIPLALALALRRRNARPLGVLFPAALWAVWEPLRALIPPCFPVSMLATSQADVLPVLQIASLTGVAGITALVAAGNAALAGIVPVASTRRRPWAALALVAALAGAAGWWGNARLARVPLDAAAPAVRVLLVDGAAATAAESTLERYLAVTAAHVDPPPDLIVWPESALPIDLERDADAWTRLRAFVDAHGTALVTGAAGRAPSESGWLEQYNSVHVFRPRYAMQTYHKRLLVPFAESWPALLGAPPAGLEPVAAGSALLVAETASARFGPLVCFEITDAASARTLAARGAGFIVNVNNDAYWGDAAPHVVWARIRAVESGLPVARGTNGGTSAVFDPVGRIVATARSAGEPTVLAALVPAPIDTVYVRTGEVFLPLCLLVVLAGLAPRRRAAVMATAPGRWPQDCPSAAATDRP